MTGKHFCMVDSLAYLTRSDRQEVCRIIGHDGSEKVFPFPDPYCRRGFTPDELIRASIVLGYIPVFIPNIRTISPMRSSSVAVDAGPKLFKIDASCPMAIGFRWTETKGHAVAIYNGMVYDPSDKSVQPLKADESDTFGCFLFLLEHWDDRIRLKNICI